MTEASSAAYLMIFRVFCEYSGKLVAAGELTTTALHQELLLREGAKHHRALRQLLEQQHRDIDDFIIKPLQRLQAMEVAQAEVDAGRHTKRCLTWVQNVQNIVQVRLFVVREAVQTKFIPAKKSAD